MLVKGIPWYCVISNSGHTFPELAFVWPGQIVTIKVSRWTFRGFQIEAHKLLLEWAKRIPEWSENETLQWRHNGYDGVSNHRRRDCYLNRLFRRRSKKTSKLRVTGLCEGNSPVTGESPPKGPVTRKMFPLMASSCAAICFSKHRSMHIWQFNYIK